LIGQFSFISSRGEDVIIDTLSSYLYKDWEITVLVVVSYTSLYIEVSHDIKG